MDLMNFIDLYFPEKMEAHFKKVSKTPEIGAILVRVFVSLVPVALVSLLITLFGAVILGIFYSALATTSSAGGSLLATGATATIASLVLLAVSLVVEFVTFFGYGVILYLIARLFGGTAQILSQFQASSSIALAMGVISAAIVLLTSIPYLGCCLLPLWLVAFGFSAYLHYRLLMSVHSLSSNNALISLVIYAIIAGGIWLGIGIIFALFGMAGSLSSSALGALASGYS